ncbi:MAG: hypothetical protein WBS20_00565, partial [Lysobacterales bacterium]
MIQMLDGRLSEGFLSRLVLLLIALAQTQAATAQQTVQISPSVVLVLKLVSKTLVKPTTGIVVSDDGIVMVPAEFAAEDGEMIVLDGGADILSNGRPAQIVDDTGTGDMAFLSVKGLKRPGIKLSANALETGGTLHLEAFPPAEYIAKGAQPLKLPVKVLRDGQTGQLSISAETPLPYVTGAILDSCGYLAGASLARGPQSLDGDKIASVLFGEDLLRDLDVLQISVPKAICEQPVAGTGSSAAKTASDKDTPLEAEKSHEPVVEAKQERALEEPSVTEPT